MVNFVIFSLRNIFSHNFDLTSLAIIAQNHPLTTFKLMNRFRTEIAFPLSYDVITMGKYVFHEKVTKNTIFGHLVVI